VQSHHVPEAADDHDDLLIEPLAFLTQYLKPTETANFAPPALMPSFHYFQELINTVDPLV
jgi:hypothetical protein